MIWQPTKYWCWHRWFAWYPIWLAREYKRAWLQTVERRWIGGIAGWEYRQKVGGC